MVYGRIAKGEFIYAPDMTCVYFLNDGYVYTAFNKVLPGGWDELTELAFMQYTREMYADSLTWGVGKPLIQIANTERYGLVLMSSNVNDASPEKAATAHAVKLAYDIAIAAYNAQSATGSVGGAAFEALKQAKDSKILTTFNKDGSIMERVTNANNDVLLAEKTTIFSRAASDADESSIGEIIIIYNVETGEISEQYHTTTVIHADGSASTITI